MGGDGSGDAEKAFKEEVCYCAFVCVVCVFVSISFVVVLVLKSSLMVSDVACDVFQFFFFF